MHHCIFLFMVMMSVNQNDFTEKLNKRNKNKQNNQTNKRT